MDKEISELKEALEYQVDIVLRLEDERLLLQRENIIQKDKLKELNAMLQKYLARQFLMVEKAVNTEHQLFVVGTQTDFDEPLSDYSISQLSESTVQTIKTQSNAVDEAKSLLKSTSRKPVVKQLKFCGDNYKENSKQEQQQPQKQQKPVPQDQAEALTREIINLTKQLQQFKLSSRAQQETIKKQEKDLQELQKQFDVKNEMLNRLRHENAEMAILINQEKFKSLRQMDNELKQEKESKVKLNQQLQAKSDENQNLQVQLKQFRDVLEKLTQEFERYRNEQQLNEESQSKFDQSFYDEEIKIRDATIQELKQQSEQLYQEQLELKETFRATRKGYRFLQRTVDQAQNFKKLTQILIQFIDFYSRLIKVFIHLQSNIHICSPQALDL
ncbi:hypothetical protein pb186bvf_013956 [Paramecium bursaria]